MYAMMFSMHAINKDCNYVHWLVFFSCIVSDVLKILINSAMNLMLVSPFYKWSDLKPLNWITCNRWKVELEFELDIFVSELIFKQIYNRNCKRKILLELDFIFSLNQSLRRDKIEVYKIKKSMFTVGILWYLKGNIRANERNCCFIWVV